MRIILATLSLVCLSATTGQAQTSENDSLDVEYIDEIEEKKGPAKVLHAEPLYIDLIRDLGARKGEKEWNIGLGLTDQLKHDYYTALVEYEFAPINRLGFEVELPFSFYAPGKNVDKDLVPDHKLNSLKLATQYTFLVSDPLNLSLAAGYIHEFELQAFKQYRDGSILQGNVYNPFFVAAKRWGNNFHTLLYTGPVIERPIGAHGDAHTTWQINSNFHYMIPGTRNFVGVEFNKEATSDDFDMTIRPQMRVAVADNILVGIVAGVPINREEERFSAFVRLIYEPGHRK